MSDDEKDDDEKETEGGAGGEDGWRRAKEDAQKLLFMGVCNPREKCESRARGDTAAAFGDLADGARGCAQDC